MKKSNKTFFYLAIICLPVFSSLSASAQFSAGVRAGANLTTDSYTGYRHDFLALPYAGIFGQYQLPVPLDFQLGVNYSGEGTNLTDLGTNDNYHVRHPYLTVPLLAQYRFAFGGYVEAGVQLGFLLSANESTNGGASVDDKQYYSSTDFDAGLGIGYEFNHNAPKGFGINLRYMRGLSNLDKNVSDDEDIKTRVLSIGLTYRLAK